MTCWPLPKTRQVPYLQLVNLTRELFDLARNNDSAIPKSTNSKLTAKPPRMRGRPSPPVPPVPAEVRTRKQPSPGAVLVGPKAAGLLGWDGFSASDPEVWLVPRSQRAGKAIIRSSRWKESTRTIDRYPVADDELVLAYLQDSLGPRPRWNGDADPITATERIELAVEWLLRNGHAIGIATLRATKTEQTIRRILLDRGLNEPATDSYAEVRFIQQMRKFGINKVFRQVPLYRGDDIVNRIDVVIPFVRRGRPKRFTKYVGIPVEVDGKAFHVDTFEKDRKRGNEHSINQTRLLVVTTHMIERNPRSIYYSICRIQALRSKATSSPEADYPPEPW
jgi:hypothetical protein